MTALREFPCTMLGQSNHGYVKPLANVLEYTNIADSSRNINNPSLFWLASHEWKLVIRRQILNPTDTYVEVYHGVMSTHRWGHVPRTIHRIGTSHLSHYHEALAPKQCSGSLIYAHWRLFKLTSWICFTILLRSSSYCVKCSPIDLEHVQNWIGKADFHEAVM